VKRKKEVPGRGKPQKRGPEEGPGGRRKLMEKVGKGKGLTRSGGGMKRGRKVDASR